VVSAENHLEQDISVPHVKVEIILQDVWRVGIGDIMVKKKYTKTKMFLDCLDEIFGVNGEKLQGDE
tara:strand:+ start:110 stop:307 length:198 start_codon:yes stop_codon:yes gene_type:complete